MAIGSVSSLVEILQQLPMLDSPSLGELPALAQTFPDSEGLAKELVRRGCLTPFQAHYLLVGKGQELVRGAYVLREKIGERPKSTTFKARHLPTQRTVALKVLSRELLSDPENSARFYREVQVAAQIAHVNVAQPFEVFPQGDAHLVALDFVEGKDLEKLVQANGPMAAVRACDFIRQAALDLQSIHERGLIHRTIKPSNIVLADAPKTPEKVKVIGLGLARALSAEERAGGFTAPEQAVDFHGVDIRADIFSLGAVFFYLLTGKAPAREGTLDVKGIPPELSLILLRMLACQPDDRFQSPAEVAMALAPLVSEAPAPAVMLAESALAGETVDAFVGGSMTHLAAYAAPRLTGAVAPSPPIPTASEWTEPLAAAPSLPSKKLPNWVIGLGVLMLLLAMGVLVWLVATASLSGNGAPLSPTPR